ncbi:TetR/AcrR family transcriptional regulator [Actinomadura vinacea]|uniref:TetR/AcrR family transcriptional regulator n=1 Tax=Actinomadura vinacea TaxID=115336 RepID=A0ABN3KAV4_9ACTN
MPQQRRSRRTRERILDAAAQVFADCGYASGTTDRIAAEARLSVGSLYQYFPNKDAILFVLVQRHMDHAAQVVRQVLAEPRPLEEWLPALTRAVVRLHAENPGLHQVLFEQAPRPPELVLGFHEAEAEAAAAVAALLRADPALKVAEPARTARYVVAIIESLTHRFISHSPELDPEELAGEICSIVTGYLR